MNATLAGTHEAISALVDFLNKEKIFNPLEIKYAFAESQPFYRLKIRLKKEIISLGESFNLSGSLMIQMTFQYRRKTIETGPWDSLTQAL